MTADMNRQILLTSRPAGPPGLDNFKLVQSPIPQPHEGEVLMRTRYLSLDPYMRGRMSAAKSYAKPVEVGEPMVGGTVGEIVASRNAKFAVGDIVLGYGGWQDYALSSGVGVRKLDPAAAPVTTALGVLGMPGMTAYAGLLEIGRPKPGETVAVAAASGAVGSVVGQIARIKGCRAIGIAGGKDKCAWLVETAKFDAAIDYKSEDVPARLKELCPKGIDIYFDNVGGDILDAALAKLAMRGRVVLCGAIATYDDSDLRPGPKHYLNLLLKRGRMEGFIVLDYIARAPEAVMQLFTWVNEGKLVDRVDVMNGL